MSWTIMRACTPAMTSTTHDLDEIKHDPMCWCPFLTAYHQGNGHWTRCREPSPCCLKNSISSPSAWRWKPDTGRKRIPGPTREGSSHTDTYEVPL